MKRIMLNLFDYDNNVMHTGVNLCDPNIVRVTIKVITGDEVAIIDYSNGVRSVHDSSECRGYDFFDAEYVILDREKEIDLIDEFRGRSDSYDIPY